MMSEYWADKRKVYEKSDWSKMPSIFAEFAIAYFPPKGNILELGAGLGQDSRYFAEKGYVIESTDLVINDAEPFPDNVTRKVMDISQPFSYGDEQFNVIYAHLSLHYFDRETTARIIDEVYRTLKPGGIFAFLVNSINDPEYNTGAKIEDDYFETDGTRKRYFSPQTALDITSKFEMIVCDDDGETYKDSAKGVHHLVRFIGRKPKVSDKT